MDERQWINQEMIPLLNNLRNSMQSGQERKAKKIIVFSPLKQIKTERNKKGKTRLEAPEKMSLRGCESRFQKKR